MSYFDQRLKGNFIGLMQLAMSVGRRRGVKWFDFWVR